MTRGMRAALVALASLLAAAPAAAAKPQPLDAYSVAAGPEQLEQLARMGYDVTEGRAAGRVVVVATRGQAAKLRAEGFGPRLVRDSKGRTERERAAAQAAQGYRVWRPYAREAFDENGLPTDNLVTELKAIAAANPSFTKLVEIGRSIRNVPIYALKVTRNAQSTPDGQRPAVLYSSTQHAREWLSTETNRRMMRLFVDNYGETGTATGVDGQPVDGVAADELTELVDTRELWFVLVANPDGYDYTFESPDTRLWRKNLRDNDGDGDIDVFDGVDPNRNFPNHWGYDEEGSSSDPTSETYRGTGPASEPETKAFDGLVKRVSFEFNNNFHTYGELLLYPLGWQMDTHAADEPIFRALSGDDETPAIPGYDPGVGAELYITNGDTNDHLYSRYGTLSWTPELAAGDPDAEPGAGGFVFQDSPDEVQAEFERQVQFSLDMARSADDPANPDSWLGNTTPDFEVDTFSVSHGDPQTVETTVRRSLGPVAVHWQVEGGDEQSAPTQEFRGGERYGDEGDVYYRWVRGSVSGASPGDTVKVWFEAGGKRSKAFTYTLAADTGAPVLLLDASNATGPIFGAAHPGAPDYEDAYTQALDALGIHYDVYDLAGSSLRPPHDLGVLSHYKAVLWYTGNDYVTRHPGQPSRSGAAKVANDLPHRIRDYLNEGGKVLLTGAMSAEEHFEGYEFSPTGEPVAGTPTGYCSPEPAVDDGCIALSNDFFQYWLGGYIYSVGAGLGDGGEVHPLQAVSDPFTGMGTIQMLQGDETNQDDWNGPGSVLVTSSLLPADRYPQFASSGPLDWKRPGAAPYEPHEGSHYMSSGMADAAYKRLKTTVDLTGRTGGKLDFWTSYDTEAHWDFLFVEARTPGQDDWTTLRITDDSGAEVTTDETGDSCASGWIADLHPFLAHYQTESGGTCTPTGTTGEWHAISGNSHGWQHLNVDLSAYDGGPVELYIAYASDWATRGLGVFVDEARLSAGAEELSLQGFESEDISPWSVPGPPEGTALNTNDWERSTTAFDEAAGVRTRDSHWLTFGLEGVGAGERQELVRRAMLDFGVLNPGGQTPPGENPGQGGGQTPGGGATPPRPRARTVAIGRKALRVRRRNRSAYLKVWCPPTRANQCRGIARMVSGRMVVARRSFGQEADRWRRVRMKLSRRAYRALRERGRLRVTATVLTRGEDGVLRRAAVRITLR